MTNLQSFAVKQLRNAANNLDMDSSNHGQSQETQDAVRSARLLVDQLANALEFGAAYVVSGRAEEFDHANQNREGQLHVG